MRDAAAMAGLAPRDGSGWDVFDALAEEVGDRVATELIGEVLYVGPRAVAAGGVNLEEISKVRIHFPSIRPLRGHTHGNEVDLIHVSIQDERKRAKGNQYRCVVDMRSGAWSTHVLNLKMGVRHPHVYTQSSVPGTTTDSFIVCQGNSKKILRGAGLVARRQKEPVSGKLGVSGRLRSYLNHISSVLNS